MLKRHLVKGVESPEKIVSQEMYRVIQTFLEGNSRKNELYLAKHIAYFQTQVTYSTNTTSID